MNKNSLRILAPLRKKSVSRSILVLDDAETWSGTYGEIVILDRDQTKARDKGYIDDANDIEGTVTKIPVGDLLEALLAHWHELPEAFRAKLPPLHKHLAEQDAQRTPELNGLAG